MTLDIANALAADVRDLVSGGEGVQAQLLEAVSMMRRDLKLAVRSSLGFSLTIHDDVPVVLTVVDRPLRQADVETTLRLTPPQPRGKAPVSVTYYGSRPGAFVDLAADLTFALDLPLDAAVLDEPLPVSSVATSVTGVVDLSDVQTAVGVLMGQGRSRSAARAALTLRAASSGTDLATAARALLRDSCAAG